MVAHHEVVAGRDHQVAVLDVIGKIDRPGFSGATVSGWRHSGKLVEEFLMVFRRSQLGVGLVLSHAVDDDDTVAQVDMVAGHADQPLHQCQVLRVSIRIRVRPGLMKTTISLRWVRGSVRAASTSWAAQG